MSGVKQQCYSKMTIVSFIIIFSISGHFVSQEHQKYTNLQNAPFGIASVIWLYQAVCDTSIRGATFAFFL